MGEHMQGAGSSALEGSGKGSMGDTAGPPGKRAQDPTATSTGAVPGHLRRSPASLGSLGEPPSNWPHGCPPSRVTLLMGAVCTSIHPVHSAVRSRGNAHH